MFIYTYRSIVNYYKVQGDQKVSVHLTITVQKNTQKYCILNDFNHPPC